MVLLMLLKSKSPMVSTFILQYLIILWIHHGKIWTEGNWYTCKCIFLAGIPLRLTQCFTFKEGQVCIHLERKTNRVDEWLRKNLKRIWVDYHNLILCFRKFCSLDTSLKISISTSLNIFDSFCAKLESTRYFKDRYLHHISVCIQFFYSIMFAF